MIKDIEGNGFVPWSDYHTIELNVLPFAFLLPIPYYSKVMEVLFSVKIFDVEFSPDLYILKSPQFKKVVFGNWSVRMCACVCVRMCVHVCEYVCVCDSKVNI